MKSLPTTTIRRYKEAPESLDSGVWFTDGRVVARKSQVVTVMAHIEPFTAIRYSATDLSNLVAPPYDILDEADKAALLAKDDHNIVDIDLPQAPAKAAGPDSVYEQAAGRLTSWLDIHCLLRDRQPAIYVYHQTYRVGRRALTRKKFFVRLKLEPFGSGGVFAHEETFGGPKEDRLKLTIATRCNVSPIFGLYPDSGNEIAAVLDGQAAREADQFALLDGVENRLWVVTDRATIQAVQAKLADKPVFIADGHHRYATALSYRQRETSESGEPSAQDPVNYVLAVLGGMEDPGATIHPYHRTIVDVPGLSAAAMNSSMAAAFTWSVGKPPSDAADLAARLASAGPGAIGFYLGRERVFATATPKAPDFLVAYEPRRKPPWRRLSYSILHRYVLGEVIGPKFCGGAAPTVHYHKSLEEAVKDAEGSAGLAALMPATTMQQLRDVCTSGELMPQKSTYFYPKLATGMVLNPLY